MKDGQAVLPIQRQFEKLEDAGYRLWFISSLSFTEREKKELAVSYSVMNEFRDYDAGFEFGERTFRYDFSLAASWGNGVISDLEFVVDIRPLERAGGIIKKISPDGFTKKDGLVSWNIKNANIKDLQNVEIVYDISEPRSASLLSAISKDLAQYFIVEASSAIPPSGNIRCTADRLTDGASDTAWCVRGGASRPPAWFEIRHKGNIRIPLTKIGILNGYLKNERSYTENGRVKKVRVDYYDAKKVIFTETLEIPERPFNARKAIFSGIDWIKIVKEKKDIRLTILEIYPGTRSDDICISEIYLAQDL